MRQILIGFTIMGALSLFHLLGAWRAKTVAPQALARSSLEVLRVALKEYVHDTGTYPLWHEGGSQDEFPALFEALFGERAPKGKGGPNAPYMYFKKSQVLVQDGVSRDFRLADPNEIRDEKIGKFLADPWGRPLVYHVIPHRRGEPDGKASKVAILYSLGPDGIDETITGDTGDDIVVDLQD